MNSEQQQIKIGLTDGSKCNYLPDQQERVAVALDPVMRDAENYEMLLANGFRRSGDTIYKPHCDECTSCHAMRLSVNEFQASKSQKRLLNKAKHLNWVAKKELDSDWFELYSRYISARHRNGSMYPPKESEFKHFSQTDWLQHDFIHIYDNEQLIAIAITDILPHSTSAFYTFFDPEYPLSLGTLGVLYQQQHGKKLGKQWLYLGYQIDECPAMNYKVRFQRHQRLVNRRWQG